MGFGPTKDEDGEGPSEQSEGAGAPEIEVTRAMIDAGVNAYYDRAYSGWETPGARQLMDMLGHVYEAMARAQRKAS